jgi:hypothetical protein
MFSRIVLILLFVAVAQARGATETQGALVKGSVILNGEGGPGVASVQITDSAHTGGPWATGSDGGFTLEYPNRAPVVPLSAVNGSFFAIITADILGGSRGGGYRFVS